MGSTHQSPGVACADCHMPYTMAGNKKISSHVWQCPLNNIEQSCTNCGFESAAVGIVVCFV
ncbi:MAG: ammonia-forming cytochrome c nitrite reductase subunit c552 [Eubacteriales bacterium]|nr:ammonia-forming cytochrome c nitrite reductase subunit c552 [Eubacteriales bacterium]